MDTPTPPDAPTPAAPTPPASGVPLPPPPAAARAGQSASALAARWIPIACLGITAALWWQVRTDIGALKDSQRALASEVAQMRKTAVIDVRNAPALGPADAVVTLVEFSDYECPFCIRHTTQTMPQLRANYIDTGRIRYVFRDFPIDELHPAAIHAHEAAHCAAEQDRFWNIHLTLFSAPGTHGDDALEARATQAGVSLPAFRACMESDRTIPAIRASASVAAELGASGTPAFFVGLRDVATDQVKVMQAISGAQPYEVFAKALDAVAVEQQKQ